MTCPTQVRLEPDRTARQIRAYARSNPGLRKDRYGGRDGTVDGLCYPLAEAYYHAQGGRDSGLRIYCLSWSEVHEDYDGTHWYLRDGERGSWIDLGIERAAFARRIPYSNGRHRSFLTGYDRPSKRATRILEAVVAE